MKNKFWLKTLAFTLLIFFYGCNSDETIQFTYEIGELGPAGGHIFFDKGEYSDGWRYIEAAPEDMTGYEWGCYNSPIEESRNLDVGKGLENTLAIIAFHENFNNFYQNPEECSDVSNGTVAAKACLDLIISSFENWHLPSEKEVLSMYQNLHLNGLGNFMADGAALYWTSTEHDDNTATTTDFANGDQGWNCKQCDFGFLRIRAVRYF